MAPILVIGKQRVGQANSVGPICSFGETEWNSVRPKSYKGETLSLHCNLGGTDSLILVRPKCYEGETESLHCELGGTDRSSRLDETLRRETESLQSHLGETEIPIGKTDLLMVCGSGYDI